MLNEVFGFSISDQDIEDIIQLLKQLTNQEKEFESLLEVRIVIGHPDLRLYAFRDQESGRIVGMASLKIDKIQMLTQNYIKGFIGDVIVKADYRGRGIGERLIKKCIETARKVGVKQVNLTSNPNNLNRATAIKLYEKLGFQKIGELNKSNYYRLEL